MAAALGAISLGTSGSITEPSGLLVSVGSDLATTVHPVGLYDWCPMNALRGILFSHGLEAMYHTVEGTRYRTGFRAPNAAITVASTGGAKAAATLTFAANPANNEVVTIGHPSRARKVTCKTTLVTTGLVVGCQVVIGANLAATIANMEKLIQGTGIHGTDYFNDQQHKNPPSLAYLFTDPGNADVAVT